MRKALTMLSVAFAIAVGATALFNAPAEAGFSVCTYRCICSVPHRCCTLNGITTCKPAPNGPLQCTQQYDC